MNAKPILALAVLFAAAPLRAERPWPVQPRAVPSDAVCRSRLVEGCMDAVIAYVEGLERGPRRFPLYVPVGLEDDTDTVTAGLRAAERTLAARARTLKPSALLGETIPLRGELHRSIIAVYEDALFHRRIVGELDDPFSSSAARIIAWKQGTADGYDLARAQLRGITH